MIGRFARGLGETPLAPVAAGVILVALGIWNGAVPLFAAYPEPDALEAVEAEAFDAIEVTRRRGAVLRFLEGERLELQAVLDPGERIVLYSDDMPAYAAVKAAVTAGPAIFGLWPEASAEEDRHRIWSLATADGPVVTVEQTVEGLKAARAEGALFPALLAAAGLALAGFGLSRWRALARG